MSFLDSIAAYISELLAPEQVLEWVVQFGEIILFLFAFIEVVPPLSFFSPGGFAIITAGALIGDVQTAISYFIAAWLGLILGNALFFQMGKIYGRDVAHKFYLTDERLQSVDEFMQRFGRISLFFGQFVGGMRPFISFIAGTTQTSVREFFFWMLLGSAAWSAVSLGGGFLLRQHLKLLLSGLGILGIVLFGIAIIFVWGAEHSLVKKKSAVGGEKISARVEKKM